MTNPKVFKKHGCDSESLRKLFEVGKKGKESEKIKKLRELIREWIKQGVERSLADYRTWAAVDLAYDAPFHQETPTIIRSILSGNNTADAALKAVKAWGLCEGDLFCKNKEGKFELNAPAIFTTLVPVVRSYLTVRTAKIFNDRNLTPLLKYEPVTNTAKNRARCQLLTNLVQTMTATMGYSTVLQRLILNPMLYSVGLMFPEEPWFKEEQEKYGGADGETEVVRQGVRYVLPHITRTFYDLQYPLASFNTDTGGAYAGYFTIARYRDVERNPIYWNKDAITYGYDWLSKEGPYANYFKQAYPCTMELPKLSPISKTTDREDAANYYSTGDADKAIFVTPLFMKLVPADWGMGTYKHPVWFRFFIGADDTVLFAEPYPYRPITVSQYDPDQNRAKNASLALEIIPSQDMLGNLLTQIVLTIKRNLANVTFYDVNLNVGTQMEDFARRTQWQYQGLAMIGYDSQRQKIGNLPGARDSFHSLTFPFGDTSQMLGAINTVISMLERLLVISPQEIGASASHQQSKAEVVLINANTTNRVAYTASFIDEAIDAWKAQLYEALIAYADEDFVAELSTDIPDFEKVMKELGLEKQEDIPGRKRILVKGKKEALRLEGFASTRDGPDRGNDSQAAQALALGIASLNQNPLVAQIVDPESVLENLTHAMILGGAPDDTKIRTNKEAQQVQQITQLAEQIKGEAVAEAMKQVTEAVAKPAAQAVAQHTQEIAANAQAIAQNTQQTAENEQAIEKLQLIVLNAMQAPPLPSPAALDPALLQPVPEQMSLDPYATPANPTLT